MSTEHSAAPHPGQPCSPETHISCTRLAWTLVNRIAALLRPDEINECARTFYEDIRAHMASEQQRAR